MKDRRPNKAKRNYDKLRKEELNNQLFAETGKMVGWILLGLITLPTIILPYICYGYVKAAKQRKQSIRQELSEL